MEKKGVLKKLRKENILHIGLIILGTIFLLIPAFHSNIWFDESYSVAIANHSFSEIWTIGSYDVHPILYYWMLKVLNLIFGQNIIVYRLFSVLGIIVLGILGLTHIKKDFGKTVGLLFTFFCFFLPTMLNYALEIRMYSWTMAFVTLMAIYSYRFIKYKKTKDLILFGIFSIISCYMHYYALAAAGIINLGLIIYVIKSKAKIANSTIRNFIIIEILQVLLYLPWFIVFVAQVFRVGSGFWITLEFPQIIYDLLDFQFRGNLEQALPLTLSILLYVYLIYIIVKNIRKKEDIKEGIIPIAIYIIIIIVMALISIITPILYERYLFTITGLLLFGICYFLAKENNKFIIGLICGAVLVLSIYNLIENINANYDESNEAPIEYLRENLQENDILIYSDIGNGGVTAAFLNENKQYFINLGNWSIEEAYKAYAPQMEIVSSIEEAIENAEERIIIVDTADLALYNQIKDNPEYKTVSIEKFETKYHNYIYNMIILEKNE